MDADFCRRLVEGLATREASTDGDDALGAGCSAPMQALRKSQDIRSALFALVELDAILTTPSTPAEKETKAVLNALKLHLPTLMNLSSSDATLAAAWTPLSITIMQKHVPEDLHIEIMMIYKRLMLHRNGRPELAGQVEAAQIAVRIFCQNALFSSSSGAEGTE